MTLGITAGIIVGLYAIGRVTGALQWYSVPTISSMPSIMPGDRIISSNLVKPKRFNYICFYHNEPEQGKRVVYVFRLCGMPGDQVHIKNGKLYVNNANADDQLNLNLPYSFPDSSLQTVADNIELSEHQVEIHSLGNGLAVASLSKKDLKRLAHFNIRFNRNILGEDALNEGIFEVFKQPWNADHFGPVTVPADHYFVLGDNRHFAQDSRYIGFVKKEDVCGTVLGVK